MKSSNLDTLSSYKLKKSFKSRDVVKSVSLKVTQGEIVGLLGPNGAGKTTSFYMIVGLIFPNAGQVFLGRENITKYPMHIRAKKGISYLPQNSSIFKKMNVENNLLSIMEVANIPSHKRNQKLEELLQQFQIGHIRKVMASALSGGERRRVEIARSLITSPKFLLLDEPFAGIDPVTVQEIQKIISSLRDKGLGVLITDHNVRETLGVCDRAYILTEGKIAAHGNPKEISEDKIVKDVYLGENFRL